MLTYYLQNEPLPKYFACQGAEQCRRVMLQTKKNILYDEGMNGLTHYGKQDFEQKQR